MGDQAYQSQSRVHWISKFFSVQPRAALAADQAALDCGHIARTCCAVSSMDHCGINIPPMIAVLPTPSNHSGRISSFERTL
jgi:hypothetical protein